MKHIGRVSKALPAPAYLVPRNIFEISSWTDIVVVIGLSIEKFFGFFVGQWIPNDLRNV
jgi:hypothetical protein